MFLESYKPRSVKIKDKKNSFLLILCIIFAILMIIFLATLFVVPQNKNNTTTNTFIGKMIETANLTKINNAKLTGIDNKNRFFTITASSAIQTKSNVNNFVLDKVKADIHSKKGKWAILNTKSAKYNILEKLLSSKNTVEIFYDDGSSLILPSMLYNLKSGILKSQNGVVLYGKWGIFKSDSFIYDMNNEIFKFYKNPIMVIN